MIMEHNRRMKFLCFLLYWLNHYRTISLARRRRRRHLIMQQMSNRKEMEMRQFREILELSVAFGGSLLTAGLPTRLVNRTTWCVERSGHWWEHIVPTFRRKQWLENFRMSKESFLLLVAQLRNHIERQDTQMRKAIEVERRVPSVIWKLATNCKYRTVGHLFGISGSSICNIMRDVCRTIVIVLQSRMIRVPTGDTLRTIIDEFEARWGFPQVAGAIDGSHIPIVRPTEYHTDYFNRKQFYSVILQRVVDYRYCFWDINIGRPGSVHDARVFASSDLYEKGQNRTLFPAWNREICETQVPILC